MTDLVATARKLARASRYRPAQADLKRSVSTAYYAVFHALARQCADLFAGAGAGRSDKAWNHAYRALDHTFVRNACRQAEALGFPSPILAFATEFLVLQEERHNADYDPDSRYSRTEALDFVRRAEAAIKALNSAPLPDRRAFAILVLLSGARLAVRGQTITSAPLRISTACR